MDANYLLQDQNWADSLPGKLGFLSPPVDLYSVARLVNITALRLRPIIPRALLLQLGKSFEVYLRDEESTDIDISVAEPTGLLSLRHRFSLAHEIAHTRFYKLSTSGLIPSRAVKNEFALEDACNRIAGNILIPSGLLRKEVARSDQINSILLQSISRKFATSLSVALTRVGEVERSNIVARCIMLVRRNHGDAQIRAFYFGAGLLPILPRPEKFTQLTEWIRGFPKNIIVGSSDAEGTIAYGARTIKFSTTELQSGDEFLLQAEAV